MDDQLACAADSAAAIEARMTIELREIGIPPRPSILARIEEEIGRDSPDFIHLANLLGRDVALAAGVIKIANSPYFAFGKKVPTIQEALLVLGLRVVAKAVAGLALHQAFKHLPNMERFWDSSARTADVSARLARVLGRVNGIRPEDAYTFALFRDCGIPVLMTPFPEYRGVLARANAEPARAFTAVEDEALSVNHAMLGAQLAADWLLPPEIVAAIRHHHDAAALAPDSGVVSPAARTLAAFAEVAEHLIDLDAVQQHSCEWEKLGAASLASLGIDAGQLPELAAECLV
ncbi:MAG TPA: HDOD domain-containing protein [Azonexus sp.]